MFAVRKLQPLIALSPWLLMLALIPLYPLKSFEAAARGVAIWWDVLFPALFPFLVIAELLVGLGIMHFIGSLFDPLMRPLFRVPGYGGFVMAMGFASGYPVSARLTAQLREQKLLNRAEGERLVAFTTSSDPIFLIGAVSVGFFHDPGLAVVLAAAHYGGSLLVGFAMRLHSPSALHSAPAAPSSPQTTTAGFARPFIAMHKARLDDGRPLGLMLQQAVANSMRLVLMIGGLVVFFSVMLELLAAVGVLDLLYAAAAGAFRLLHVPDPLARAAVDGMFEVTLGAKSAGAAPTAVPLLHKAAVAAAVLSWAGLSVHAQIVSLLSRTDLRYTPFLMARLLHGIFAFLLVYLLWRPLAPVRDAAAAVWPALAGSYSAALPLPGMFGAALSLLIFLASLLIVPLLCTVCFGIPRLFRRSGGAGGR